MLVLDRRKRRRDAVIGRVAGERLGKGDKSGDADRRKAIQQKLKEVEQKRSGDRKFRLPDLIAQAGLSILPLHFVLLCIGAGLCMGLMLYISVSPLMGVLGLVVGGLGLPRFVLSFMTKRRLTRFTALFADGIDVIVRGVRSGLPLGECIKIIGRELPEPVGGEFRMVTEGLRLGLTVEESLVRMTARVPTPETRFFAIVIGIQQQTGGNLADTLSKLTEVLRARKRMRDKVQAMSSEAKASAGIIGSLPPAVGGILFLVAPDYIGLLFTTDMGNWVIFGSLLWMGFGIMVMRGMISFEM